MSDRVPDFLDTAAQEHVCPTTVSGWLWYCDEHDTHGNADTQEEAKALAVVHRVFGAEEAGEDGECEVLVWLRTPHERVDR